ncbi:pre-mRNA splicing factor [Catenaria anguillulae PL171]|uniref:RNA helicase n=1 Tax=Catenaria anguillulae PL171 TaxID=765915 RepID=A0A1Y2I068_9FUNG|nr:pre-mRNA splicing factor [Catenaria anguillulae PL171]
MEYSSRTQPIDAGTDTDAGLAEALLRGRSQWQDAGADDPPSRQRLRLPIVNYRESILYAVETFPVVILVGQTGTGKSTQIPQYLHEAGWTANGRMIGVTQPRRIAATTIAQRVAEEMEVRLGDTVGYAIRFEDRVDPARTRIKYMTDGMLFREIMMDPLLTRYNVVMIDEAHERSVYSDLVLGLLKLILMHRKDLRIIVSSATLDADFFLAYFSNTEPKGKVFPLDIHYLKQPCDDYVEQSIRTVLEIHQQEPPGDVLVFLTGRDEIDTVAMQLRNRSKSSSLQDQQLIFSPTPRTARKVVVATNIAEASLTVPDITYVIDCGFVKQRHFHPISGHDALVIVPTSQAAADQRAGRAGRHRAGKVYRLYPHAVREGGMPKTTEPELARSSLLAPILQLKAMGIKHVGAFPFPTTPQPERFAKSLEMLMLVGAVDDRGELTELGTRVAELPLEPLLAVALLKSHEFGCVKEMLAIVAMLSVENVFSSAKGHDPANFKQVEFAVEEGDHLTYLNAYFAFEAANRQSAWCHKHKLNFSTLTQAAKIRTQLTKFLAKYNIPPTLSCNGNTDTIRKCLVSAFFAQAAAAQPDGTYRLLRDGSMAWIHPMSALFERAPPYVVFHGIVETDRVFLREVTAVEHGWLKDAAPSYYDYKSIRH